MTTSKEQEAFGLVVERQKSSASENGHQARVPAFSWKRPESPLRQR